MPDQENYEASLFFSHQIKPRPTKQNYYHIIYSNTYQVPNGTRPHDLIPPICEGCSDLHQLSAAVLGVRGPKSEDAEVLIRCSLGQETPEGETDTMDAGYPHFISRTVKCPLKGKLVRR